MVHLPAAALTALHRVLSQDRSPAEAAAVTRQMGFETGESFYAAFRDWLGSEPSELEVDEFWNRFAAFFASLGWGRLHFERSHGGVAELSSDEWAEAEPGGQAHQPTCHFTTGLFADLLGRVSGDGLAVLEVECRSRGDDRCRFALGGADALRQIYERIRDGDSFQDAVEGL
jgi:predicted hydrocarbon binding protein